MWEKRADQKRKLKPNAVPTIFGFFLKEKIQQNAKEMSEIPIDNLAQRSELECTQLIDKVLDKECEVS